MINLRPYQSKAVNLTRNSFRTGHKAPIIVLPCRSGKTVIASYIAKQMQLKGTILLFIVHRNELLAQTITTFDKFSLQCDVGMVITVGNNLNLYKPDVIIFDECNFALAKTWRKVFNAYPSAYKIGLSATPCRLSGEPMGDLFDDIIECITADELIKLGYLSDYDYYAPKLDINISTVKKSKGDYDKTQLSELMCKPKIYGNVLKYYNKLASNRKSIVYCASIIHSKAVASEFRANGYKCEHLDGTTPKAKRQAIIEAFRVGEIQILCNVDLISYGFDVPDCDCTVLLRPTQSVALYIQQSMRCLTAVKGKKALILDFVDNVHRFGMPTDRREWSLTGRTKCSNINGEPDVKARMCGMCYKTYGGINAICPYCGYDNGKSRKQIEEDKKAELEKIEKINKYKKKQEVWDCMTETELIKLGTERGYKNAGFWAKQIINSRRRKRK